MSRKLLGWFWRASSLSLWVALVFLPAATFGQDDESERRVRVPQRHANVHQGPATFHPVLVLVAQDTVLPVVGSRGEWLEVELSPELRETGMVLRWYRNEERGWVHQSTVEPAEAR